MPEDKNTDVTEDSPIDSKDTSDAPDLDKVTDESLKDLDEESQKKIKGFQADYTKKTQALAEERKKLEELKERAKRADDLEHWLETDPVVKEFNEWKEKRDKKVQEDVTDDVDDDEDDSYTDPKVRKLEKTVARLQEEIGNTVKAAGISNKMLVDFTSEVQNKEFRDIPFEIEARKVFAYAKENGMVDMKKAIKGCYSDEFREFEIEKRINEEKEKWEEKEKTNVLSGTLPLGRQVRKVIARKRNST